MEHEALLSYMRRLLPEDYLTWEDLCHWRFGPVDLHTRPSVRIGWGDQMRIVPYRPLEGFPDHEIAFYALIYLYAGSLTFTAGSRRFVLSQGQAALLTPGGGYRVDPCGPGDLAVMLALEPGLLRERLPLWDLPAFSAFLHLDDAGPSYRPDEPVLLFDTARWPGSQWYIDELCCEHFDPDRRTYMAMPNLIPMIFIALDRCSDASVQTRQTSSSATVHAILRHIKSNYTTATLQSTASRFGFSTRHITYLIHQETGMGFQDYKQYVRIVQSERLLRETDLTVTQIAHEVGIRNMPLFYSLFQAQYGATPAAYRASARTQPPPAQPAE